MRCPWCSIFPQTAAAGTGGGRRGAGQEQRAATKTAAEKKTCWPEKSSACPCSVREQRGERKCAAECLQLYPGRSPCQKPNASQSSGQGEWKQFEGAYSRCKMQSFCWEKAYVLRVFCTFQGAIRKFGLSTHRNLFLLPKISFSCTPALDKVYSLKVKFWQQCKFTRVGLYIANSYHTFRL